jgi:CelD/BcsL family acetyltransferase involved in cellulose biosynthesis
VQTIASGLREQSFEESPREREDLHCEVVADPQRLYEFEDEWRALWTSLADTTPFQSPDWLLPWWKHYGQGELLSFAFWHGGRLVGFAPMYVFRSRRPHPVPQRARDKGGAAPATEAARRLFLLGTGNSDYLDVLFDPMFRLQCWGTLLTEIRTRGACWDVCSFQRLRRGSPLLEDAVNVPELRLELSQQVPCVAIDLDDPGHGSVLLKRSHGYARKLQKLHSFSFEEATAGTLDEFSEALELLHQERWQEEGYQGALSSARDRCFHREVARRFLEVKMLMFYGIRMGGKLIAAIYGYRVRDRIYSYLSGFDPEYARKSVGAISIGYAVDRAMQSGCRAFDFLQGQEPYKYTWGARDVPCFARRILKM